MVIILDDIDHPLEPNKKSRKEDIHKLAEGHILQKTEQRERTSVLRLLNL